MSGAFWRAIPRRYPFPGIAKVVLELGTPPGPPRFRRILNVAMVIDPTFDSVANWQLSPIARQHAMIDQLADAVAFAAVQVGADPAPAHAIAATLHAGAFPLVPTPDPVLPGTPVWIP